jgi:putative ABC transport system permease protein
MRTLATIRIAGRSLRRTLLRSFLTTLGVIIGVASVITLVSLGAGAKVKIETALTSEQMRRLVINALVPMRDWGPTGPPKIGRGAGLTLEDYDEIRREIRGIDMGSPSAAGNGMRAKANGRSVAASVVGGNAFNFPLTDKTILRGVVFSDIDVRRASSVCLLSETAERALFGDTSSLGRIVTINAAPFVVLGVVKDIDTMGGQGDATIYLPITSLLRRLEPGASISITLRAEHREQLDTMKSAVRELLEGRRGKRTVDFQLYHAMEGRQQLAEGARTMTLLLAAIAGISLLVGGIGIMNTMLVNVAERTREIGIRLAIGTRERDIMRQFLVEATILSLLGGLIGMLLGFVAAKLLTYLNGWPTAITATAIAGAFVCSVSVGVFFGYYPARRAARLDPIVALRSE